MAERHSQAQYEIGPCRFHGGSLNMRITSSGTLIEMLDMNRSGYAH